MQNLEQSWECIAELRGHRSWIYGVPIISAPRSGSLRDRTLASVSWNQILLWDIDTQKVKAILEGHEDIISSISLSPDGQTLASGSLDKTICLWNIERHELICSLAKRKDPIYSVTFSPDGRLLAAGGERKYRTPEGRKSTVYLWDLETKELVSSFLGHNLRINSIAFSPNNQFLATGSNDSTIRLWDISTGKELYSLNGHSNKVSMVAFTPNSKDLITSGDGGIKIWDLQAKKLKKCFAEESEYVECFALDPNGKILAFEVHNGIEIWHVENAQKLKYLDFMWPTSMSFSFDGQLFASGDASAFSEDAGLVKVWRVPNFEEQGTNFVQEQLLPERQKIEKSGYFDIDNIEDARQRIITSIVQRQGQGEFRRRLLEAYGGKCPITGCDVDSALEAAHIIPYQGAETNHPTNGLPLRADIHTLFDLHLLSIQPESYKVVIAANLMKTCYADLAGRQLTLPVNKRANPNQNALGKHYEVFLTKASPST